MGVTTGDRLVESTTVRGAAEGSTGGVDGKGVKAAGCRSGVAGGTILATVDTLASTGISGAVGTAPSCMTRQQCKYSKWPLKIWNVPLDLFLPVSSLHYTLSQSHVDIN
jgi:hypothetical protein